MSIKGKSPLLVFAVSLAILAVVILLNLGNSAAGENGQGRARVGAGQTPEGKSSAGPRSKNVPTSAQSTTPSVRVTRATPESYQAQVTGHGAATAHYQLTLNSRVAGQVDSVADNFEVGSHIQQGQVLLSLESSAYKAALASAELAYLQAQREMEQARTEWAASGLEGEPDSPLVFYEPQLAEALASYEAARANYDDTRVKAAFDGVVTSRLVSPGSYVAAGSELGEVVSRDRVEISVPLAADEWSLLPTLSEMIAANWTVKVRDVETGRVWLGHVLRAQSELDATTRQRSLIVAVDNPFEQTPALLPGTFTEVQVPGITLDGLWALPSTSLSQRGEIWYIDDNNTLNNFNASPAFAAGDTIYVRPPSDLKQSQQQVLTSPMNSYVEGTAVEPLQTPQEATALISEQPTAPMKGDPNHV